MGILDLLFGSSDTTTFYQLYNKLRKWKEAKVFPFEYNLPKDISLPTDFWDKITKLNKQTISDGNERAVSIYWADGEIVVSQITTGNEKSVTTNSNISVKYSQHPTRKEYARKEVLLNNSVYKKTDIYYKKIPKKIEVAYLFNMHTHPQHQSEQGNTYYNFFSAQDVKSLINSKVAVTGLITDKLWLLIRTDKTPNNVENIQDKDMNIEYLNNTLHIGVYCANFHNKLVKQLPTTTTGSTTTSS